MIPRGLRPRIAVVVATLILGIVPAVAAAGLPNAVIGAGNVQGATALLNARGRTVYMWTSERHGRANCYDSCLPGWKPVLTGGKVFARAGSGVDQKLLGTTRRRN